MTVEEMIEEVKSATQRHFVGVAMGQWDSAYSAKDPLAEAVFIGLFSLGIPLETLAALKAGTWKAVPTAPTEKMLDALWDRQCRDADLLDMWAKALAAAPANPESENDR